MRKDQNVIVSQTMCVPILISVEALALISLIKGKSRKLKYQDIRVKRIFFHSMPTKKQLIIFDTTLRDGEQSPGVTLTVEEKVEIAKQLSRLGVDVCEAGFPIASDGDFKAVKRIAKEVGHLTIGRPNGTPMVICGLARATKGDIQRAYDAIKSAPRHRIHTFLATSDIHLQYKLKITREECIAKSASAVAFAKSLGVTDIEFSPEDAGRSDRDFLVKVLKAVVAAGATTLNIPDTVGYTTPEEYGELIKYLVEHVDPSKKVFATDLGDFLNSLPQ